MNKDFHEKSNASRIAFEDVVWPEIRGEIGDGRLHSNEGTSSPLDVIAGIDAWQIIEDRGVAVSIASRVQFVERSYYSFTVRYDLSSGKETEHDKRLRAVELGATLPDLTVQAYIAKLSGEFINAGIVGTRELWDYISRNMASLLKNTKANPEDGNLFYPVYWQAIRRAGIRTIIVPDDTNKRPVDQPINTMARPEDKQLILPFCEEIVPAQDWTKLSRR